jgi:hypothetical protein
MGAALLLVERLYANLENLCVMYARLVRFFLYPQKGQINRREQSANKHE